VSANAGGTEPVLFGFGTDLQAFSAQKLFTALNSNITDVHFFLPGTSSLATTTAFGVIFTGVEVAGGTKVELEIAAVPSGRLAGIVCMRGSALSHTAVLARALGIPAVVSLAALPTARLDGCEMVVDGYEARIYVQPSRKVLEAFQQRIGEEKALATRLVALRDQPAETLDGIRLTLYANTGLVSDTAAARGNGAEGVGLYRTEYPFLLREAFPAEDEQYQIYRELLESFAKKTVTLRTLDVGGDKILSYFPVQEDNPFLGCRGIRFSLDHPEIFLIQLRAMLRANAGLNNLQCDGGRLPSAA
jgi:phosphotransferase system enzyme I (PtsP)